MLPGFPTLQCADADYFVDEVGGIDFEFTSFAKSDTDPFDAELEGLELFDDPEIEAPGNLLEPFFAKTNLTALTDDSGNVVGFQLDHRGSVSMAPRDTTFQSAAYQTRSRVTFRPINVDDPDAPVEIELDIDYEFTLSDPIDNATTGAALGGLGVKFLGANDDPFEDPDFDISGLAELDLELETPELDDDLEFFGFDDPELDDGIIEIDFEPAEPELDDTFDIDIELDIELELDDFDLEIDEPVVLEVDTFGSIFSDGFESGDVSAWTSSSPDTMSLRITSPDPNVHFEIIGVDPAELPREHVDGVVNSTPTASPIPDQQSASDAPFSLDASTFFADADVGDTLSFGATLTGGGALPAWLGIDPASGLLSGTPTAADIGTIQVEITATDAAGASVTSAPFSMEVSQANTAPTVTPIGAQTAMENLPFDLDAAPFFDDADAGDTLSFEATLASGGALPAWLAIDPASGVLSGTPTADDIGTIQVEITATDAVGASVTSAPFSLEVVNTNDSPTVTPIGDQMATEDQPFDFDPTPFFDDVDAGDSLTYGATLAGGGALPAWLAIDPASGLLSGTPLNGDVGSIQIEITATDAAGASATSAPFSIDVANTNDPPTVTPIDAQTATEGSPFNLDVSPFFDDADAGDSLTFGATLAGGGALPAWLNVDPASGVLSGTPSNADVGTIQVEITATDVAGASVTSAPFSIGVGDTNAPPTVTAIGDQSATEDLPFDFDSSAFFDDVDAGDSLTFGATLAGGGALPAWLNVDPASGVLSGTPSNDDVGTIQVEITATDAAGAGVTSAPFSIDVANANDPPTVTPIGAQTAMEGQPFDLNVAPFFDDVDAGDQLSFVAALAGGGALPAWLSIDAASGLLAGTPSNADVGAIQVEVTASDLAGASVTSAAFEITIDGGGGDPFINEISGIDYVDGDPAVVRVSFPTEPGVNFILQYSTDLITWSDSANATGTGDIMVLEQTPDDSKRLFFRIARQ